MRPGDADPGDRRVLPCPPHGRADPGNGVIRGTGAEGDRVRMPQQVIATDLGEAIPDNLASPGEPERHATALSDPVGVVLGPPPTADLLIPAHELEVVDVRPDDLNATGRQRPAGHRVGSKLYVRPAPAHAQPHVEGECARVCGSHSAAGPPVAREDLPEQQLAEPAARWVAATKRSAKKAIGPRTISAAKATTCASRSRTNSSCVPSSCRYNDGTPGSVGSPSSCGSYQMAATRGKSAATARRSANPARISLRQTHGWLGAPRAAGPKSRLPARAGGHINSRRGAPRGHRPVARLQASPSLFRFPKDVEEVPCPLTHHADETLGR